MINYCYSIGILLAVTILLPLTTSTRELPSRQPLANFPTVFFDEFKKNETVAKNLLSTYNSTSFFLTHLKNGIHNIHISDNCKMSWEIFEKSLPESWTLTMIDAYGKVSSDLLLGNIAWPGSFSQCNSVVEIRNKSLITTDLPLIHGQYCWLNFAINATAIPALKNFALLSKTLNLREGICIPHLCSSHDIENITNTYIDTLKAENYVTSTVECIPAKRKIWDDPKAIICLTFCILMALIIVIGTTYDALQVCDVKLNDFRETFRFQSPSLSTSINDDKAQIIENGNENSAEKHFVHSGGDEINTEENTDETKSTPKIIGKILVCFSIYTNGSKLMNMTSGQGTLTCLNGIRVFSMLWIILGHSYLYDITLTNNVLKSVKWLDTLNFTVIVNGMLAVDSFFAISGLLVTYLYLREYEKNEGRISWVKFYVHRYFRLTPLYAVVLFVFTDGFGKYYSNGPFWPEQGISRNNCESNWWWNFLYINNFLKNSEMCMGHTWYLANDMQFHIISPLILIFLKKRLPIAIGICGGFILTSWITTGVLVSVNDAYHPDLLLKDFNTMFDLIYDKPYCRIAAYVIGMLCGFALHQTKCQFHMSKLLVILGWLTAIGLSSAVVFGTYHAHMTIHTYSLYHALSRTGWSIALVWMIFACCNGYGGIINDILSWPLWQPLGRLTYAAYLIQSLVINAFILSMDISFPFSYTTNIAIWLSCAVISYFFAIFLSLSFEAPFLALEKLFV